jgi:hypothetical protein
LFISAATLCRFIGDPKWQPNIRLAEVLSNQTKYATKMEKTYLPIFERLLADQDDEDSEIFMNSKKLSEQSSSSSIRYPLTLSPDY